MAEFTASSDDPSLRCGNVTIYTNPNHDLYLHRTSIPTPGPSQCLIHVRATGICGSDVHFWKRGRIGEMIVTSDYALGHESAGVVVGVGSGVTKFGIGSRVAIECGVPCMKASCEFCRSGKYNACPNVVFCSTPPHDGTLARYHVHPEDWLHELPDPISFEEGALLEPLSVALAGIDRAGIRLGDPLLICGAGPIGLTTLMAAHAAGANPITITDLEPHRLSVAKKLIPRVRTVHVGLKEEPKDTAERVITTMGQRAAVVFECTGVESSVHSAIYSCSFGGLVFVIGCGKDVQEIPFAFMSGREIDLKFQYRYRNTYPKAIGLVTAGLIDLRPLVTHRYSLEDGIKAFQTATDPAAKAIKVHIFDG